MAKEKENRSHGIMSDLWYILRLTWLEYRAYIFVYLLFGLTAAMAWTVYPFISKYAVEAIAVPKTRGLSLLILAGLLIAKAFSEINQWLCNRYISCYGSTKFNWTLIRRLIKKRMAMDYQNSELTSANDSFQKAMSACRNQINKAFEGMKNTFANLVQVAVYTVVLFNLSPIAALITGLPSLICFWINRRAFGWQWRNTDKWTGLDRQLGYVSSAAADFGYAKDMRLYGMGSWLERKFAAIWGKRLAWYKKFDGRMTLWRFVIELISVLSAISSYGIVIYMVCRGNIGAGDFVLYFSAIEQYSNAVWQLADNLSAYGWYRDNINFYRDYLDIPDKFNHGKGAALPDGQCEIEFRNVSYTYPNADSPTIKNISFKLHKGERLALVGLNGAGKSTLIKLMCGLYDPTEGQILLNGTDLREFNREEYYSLFSTVFQDFDILPVTVAQNVTLSADPLFDREGTIAALKKSGLYRKAESLPKGFDTLLAKSVFDDATDFSGGEMQKLALAKALYKDAPLLLLDEPTAALDPISEQEMYLRYADFSKGKASVFISHRLASTRFCDNIILIENGGIAEQGTHSELMKQGGRYAELFEIQSAYYKDS